MSTGLAWTLVVIGGAVLVVAGYLVGARRRPQSPAAPLGGAASGPGHDELIAAAAAQERERIYSDLHDDLGARLLELIYSAPDQAVADRARAILQDLRDVVSRSRSEPGTLQDVLASIRGEARQRLAAAGAELAWEAAEDLPDPALDQGTSLHLHRIVREAISNAIRHAHARRLRVRVALGSGRQLMLELTDEGGDEALEPGSDSSGTGVRNMRARAAALQGRIDWTPGTLGGTKVLLKAPLPPEASA